MAMLKPTRKVTAPNPSRVPVDASSTVISISALASPRNHQQVDYFIVHLPTIIPPSRVFFE
jgi:hypothetical protein